MIPFEEKGTRQTNSKKKAAGKKRRQMIISDTMTRQEQLHSIQDDEGKEVDDRDDEGKHREFEVKYVLKREREKENHVKESQNETGRPNKYQRHQSENTLKGI